MPRAKPPIFLWIVMLVLTAPVPHGRSQTKDEPPLPSRYQVTQWKDTDGLPQNSVNSLARTPDGYLWFGTAEGLVRFDGVRFTVFDVGNTPSLGNSSIESLLADHTGTLWIGTAGGGLIGYHDGVFTAHTARDGLSGDYIICLCEDRVGTVWAGTLTHGLNRWRDGRWSPAVPALADSDINALAADPSGDVWAGTPDGLFRVRGDVVTAYPPPEGTSDRRIRSLCCDHTGKLWVGTTLGLQRLDEGRLVTVNLGEGGHTNFVQAVCEARDGTLWIGHGGEVLCRGADGRFAPCRTQGELAISAVWAFYEDPEGNVWIGTDTAGLLRLRHGAFGAYTTLDGLSTDYLRAVCQDAAGTMWVATSGGLDRWQDGRFVPVGESVGLMIPAVAGTSQGTLWAATSDENRRVCRVEGDRLVPLPTTDKLARVHALLADRTGALWIGTSEGLFHWPSADSSPPAAGMKKVLDGYTEGLFRGPRGRGLGRDEGRGPKPLPGRKAHHLDYRGRPGQQPRALLLRGCRRRAVDRHARRRALPLQGRPVFHRHDARGPLRQRGLLDPRRRGGQLLDERQQGGLPRPSAGPRSLRRWAQAPRGLLRLRRGRRDGQPGVLRRLARRLEKA